MGFSEGMELEEPEVKEDKLGCPGTGKDGGKSEATDELAPEEHNHYESEEAKPLDDLGEDKMDAVEEPMGLGK